MVFFEFCDDGRVDAGMLPEFLTVFSYETGDNFRCVRSLVLSGEGVEGFSVDFSDVE